MAPTSPSPFSSQPALSTLRSPPLTSTGSPKPDPYFLVYCPYPDKKKVGGIERRYNIQMVAQSMLESGLSLCQTRKRGPTRNIGLLALRPGERILVSFNEYGQVVNEIKGRRLKSYLGTLVRNQHNVPLQVNGWKSVIVDDKEKIWALVLEKFDVEEDRKDNILSLAGDKYRSYRSKMKATYYEPWATNDERLRHKPPLVSDADWRWLVQ